MNKEQFERDCKYFEDLIQEGKSLADQAWSVRGGSLDWATKTEQKCTSWFVKTKNYMVSLFGEDDLDIKMFRESFGMYKTMNLVGIYSGSLRFVKEDMYKGIGVLEGIYYSFKNMTKSKREELIKVLKRSPDRIRVMFDNDILNKITEGQLDLDKIKKADKFEFYATHIQTDQVSRCPNSEKRAMLTLNLTKLSPIMIQTESGVFGVSRYGECKFSNEDSKVEELRKGNVNHTEDALIGEVAIKRRILLVTNDKTLKSRVNANGGRAINLKEFEDLI